MRDSVDGEMICPFCENTVMPHGMGVWVPFDKDGVYRIHCEEEEKELIQYIDGE